MPWVVTSSQTTLTFVLWISLFVSFVRMDCNTTKMTVPKPNLKYMLDGHLHVTWSDESHGSWNYSANYCCQKLFEDDVGWCERRCPHYAKMAICDFKKNLCMIMSKQYIKYQVYLSVEFQGCSFRGDVKELTPTLRIAHPPQVPIINMVNENNRMVVQWSEPSTTKNMGVCYFVTCHGMEGLNKGKQVINKSRHKSLTVFIDYDPSRHPFTSYVCCVKVHLCRYGPIFSDKVCNQSRTPATAPSDHPKMLCGNQKKCPTVRVKNNLRDITLYWQLPVNSSYNGIPTEIRLGVRKGDENSTVTYTLNGTATTYVLKGLEMDVDYHVTLKLCTIHGRCSSISTPVLLRAEMGKSGDTVDVFSSLDLVVVVVAGTLILVLVLIACYIVDTRRNRGRAEQARRLPNIREPNVNLPHDQAWSGESVATSIAMNTDYDQLNGRHCEHCDIDQDNISQNSNGSGYDTCSVDSYESSSGLPLLAKHSSKKTEAHVDRQRVTVTYIPQQPGTITSLKPCISDDEGSKFV